MRSRCRGDRDRVGDVDPGKGGLRRSKTRVRPGRRNCGQEGASLRGRFKAPLARRLERGAELGTLAERRPFAAISRDEEDGVVAPGAVETSARRAGFRPSPE
jgi:hypothetical protein